MKLFKIFLISTVSFWALASCKKNNALQEQNTTQKLVPQNSYRTYDSLSAYLTAINEVGEYHNGCMDAMYEIIKVYTDSNWTLGTRNSFDSVFTNRIIGFWSAKGYDFQNFTPFDYYQQYDENEFSTDGLEIIDSIYKLQSMFIIGTINRDSFLVCTNYLKTSAFRLSDEEESMIIGIGVSVGEYSARYWKANAGKFLTLNGESLPSNYDIEIYAISVGGADVVGVIRGGWVGAGGGLPGAIIGASFGGACASFGQAILDGPLKGKYNWITDWLPF